MHMNKPATARELQETLKQAEEAGAHPGDPVWQPRIERAWRKALDAGVNCHIHTTMGDHGRWILTIDVTNTPELDPEKNRGI